MIDHDLYLDVVIALFALLNPLFAVTVFLGLTGDFSGRQRQRTAIFASITVLVALTVAALIGDQILRLFGVHVPSFQIAGGLIVLTIALGMLKGEMEEKEDADRVTQKTKDKPDKSIAVYPLGIPLLAGPGSIVTVIVFSSRIEGVRDFIAVALAIVSVVVVLWLAMAFATTAARFLNETAINVGTKVLGILLAAVSVEMILSGIDAHFLRLLPNG